MKGKSIAEYFNGNQKIKKNTESFAKNNKYGDKKVESLLKGVNGMFTKNNVKSSNAS